MEYTKSKLLGIDATGDCKLYATKENNKIKFFLVGTNRRVINISKASVKFFNGKVVAFLVNNIFYYPKQPQIYDAINDVMDYLDHSIRTRILKEQFEVRKTGSYTVILKDTDVSEKYTVSITDAILVEENGSMYSLNLDYDATTQQCKIESLNPLVKYDIFDYYTDIEPSCFDNIDEVERLLDVWSEELSSPVEAVVNQISKGYPATFWEPAEYAEYEIKCGCCNEIVNIDDTRAIFQCPNCFGINALEFYEEAER